MHTLRHTRTLLLICTIIGSCTGCLNTQLSDQSKTARYRDLIGREFTLRSDFTVYGVRRDLRAATPDFYQMIPAHGPGVDGPEIIDFGILPAGTRVRLATAYEESPGGKPVYEVTVASPPDPKFAQLDILINNAWAFKLYTEPVNRGDAPDLSGRWFAPVNAPAP